MSNETYSSMRIEFEERMNRMQEEVKELKEVIIKVDEINNEAFLYIGSVLDEFRARLKNLDNQVS